jgi:hypothetical protein
MAPRAPLFGLTISINGSVIEVTECSGSTDIDLDQRLIKIWRLFVITNFDFGCKMEISDSF